MAPDEPDDDDNLQEQADRLAARSDAEWWKEDHLFGQDADRLSDALKELCDGCGCDVGRLLSDLREIERLSNGYSFFLGRRELTQIIKQAKQLAQIVSRVEMSKLTYSLPAGSGVSSKDLSTYAEALETAREATARSPIPIRSRRIRELIVYIDTRVGEYGKVGKGDADAALAVLLTAVTHEKVTQAALRVARSRINQRRGRKRIPRDKPRVARRLRGSRARDRQSREVPYDDYLAGQNRDDGEDRDDDEPEIVPDPEEPGEE